MSDSTSPSSMDIDLQNLLSTKKKPLRTDRFVRRQPRPRNPTPSPSQHPPKHSSLSPDSTANYQTYLSDTLNPSSPFDSSPCSSLRSFTLHLKKSSTSARRGNPVPVRRFRVLGWKDNYYTNLLDWSYNNFICAAYLNQLCLYNMAITEEFESSLYRKCHIGLPNSQYITSIKGSPCQNRVAIGGTNGGFRIFDYFKQKCLYSGYQHVQRIGTIQWSEELIFTGSKDQFIRAFDPRSKKPVQMSGEIHRAHTQEICGVRQQGKFLSSGGNDNKVNIYDIRKMAVLDTYSHGAAVKAMAWMGDKHLATGGGTADKKIKFWSDSQKVYQEFDTGSQVCSLCWSPGSQELVSSQGFSLNQIIVWNRSGERQLTFHGHNTRVLYSALSPNGEYLATGAGDQFLKIWKLFPGQEKK